MFNFFKRKNVNPEPITPVTPVKPTSHRTYGEIAQSAFASLLIDADDVSKWYFYGEHQDMNKWVQVLHRPSGMEFAFSKDTGKEHYYLTCKTDERFMNVPAIYAQRQTLSKKLCILLKGVLDAEYQAAIEEAKTNLLLRFPKCA